MTDEQIQELIYTFLDAHSPYVISASERELFGLVRQAVGVERERCAGIAESFIPSEFTGVGKLGNSFAVARDSRARTIAYAIRNADAPNTARTRTPRTRDTLS